jgi:GNAT superfamily N-acetyltransferase
MPDPVPAALLGRLAVDRGWQGRGFGAALLRDADGEALVRALMAYHRGEPRFCRCCRCRGRKRRIAVMDRAS